MNPNFQEVINRFIARIESLKFSFPLIINTINFNQQNAEKEFTNFTAPFLTKERSENQLELTLQLPIDQLTPFHKIRKKAAIYSIFPQVIKGNFIISLISEFDIHLSSLIRTIFYIKPEILNALDKQISFKQLLEFESIDAAKEYIIEKEIESVLRESHTEHFKWLEHKTNLKTLRDFPAWSTFIEITERRNLFVHCDGIVSSQYINVCKDNKVDLLNCQIGKKLEVTEKYFNNAYDCIFEVGVKLAHTVWRKIHPQSREIADITLNNLCLKLISEEEYKLANMLLDFAMSEPIFKQSSQQIKLSFILNKAQILKWIGDEKQCSKLLMEQDWSACSDEFQLGKAVLLNKFEEACKIMKNIGSNSEKLSIIQYREWPIFKEFRKTEQFLKVYQEIFQESFELVTEMPSAIQTDKNQN
ncbi:hypothetical protein Cri9333_4823 (plasmid) [Crinalium epipsammum PCC 9333]|uniref:Uncharacterized protein n=1 Tax=Crinalium epipsammum PCC 9333 TaxID=1173022 RepID=K9W815_9CYAN|nr:hypothetical protein [Crinalium epipsammum]AFZ15590.1 hypothetical protein Cri9333_4823 [Crinalium epipsammum PCC 9333]